METAPKDRNILLFDGEIHEGWWGEIDYDDFRRLMGWVYGNAEIDSANFRPTHWAEKPNTPEQETLKNRNGKQLKGV